MEGCWGLAGLRATRPCSERGRGSAAGLWVESCVGLTATCLRPRSPNRPTRRAGLRPAAPGAGEEHAAALPGRANRRGIRGHEGAWGCGIGGVGGDWGRPFWSPRGREVSGCAPDPAISAGCRSRNADAPPPSERKAARHSSTPLIHTPPQPNKPARRCATAGTAPRTSSPSCSGWCGATRASTSSSSWSTSSRSGSATCALRMAWGHGCSSRASWPSSANSARRAQGDEALVVPVLRGSEL